VALAPPFDPDERIAIAAWLDDLKDDRFRAELTTESPFLTEALYICALADDEPRWIIHKTRDGRFATREWPGLADIVMTIEECFADVSEAMRDSVARRPLAK